MPTTTNYIWDEDNYLAETDENNVVQTVYTNEPEQYGNLVSSRISGTTSYHHFDALGSTRQLTNAAGTVTDTVIYDAWGNAVTRIGTTGIVFLWIGVVGYYFDVETGHVYVRERVYGPVIGRWTSLDPVLQLPQMNLFAYGRNTPAELVDPSGLVVVVGLTEAKYKDNRQCNTTIAVNWQFRVDDLEDPATKKPGAPCTGYIVQRVKVVCSLRGCTEKKPVDHTFYYFEAWKVQQGQFGPGNPKKNAPTDTGEIPIVQGRGTISQDTEIRFYCLAGRDGTGDLSKKSSWERNNVFGRKFENCGTTSGFLLAFDGGTAGGEKYPDFWKKTEGLGKAGARQLSVNYCCCRGLIQKPADYVKLDFSPVKQEKK